MSEEYGNSESIGGRMWSVQPIWLKRISTFVMLPAWAFFAYCVISGKIGSPEFFKAICVVASIGSLELLYVVKALLNEEL